NTAYKNHISNSVSANGRHSVRSSSCKNSCCPPAAHGRAWRRARLPGSVALVHRSPQESTMTHVRRGRWLPAVCPAAGILGAVVVTGVQEATEAAKTTFTVSHVDASQMPVPGANPLTQIQGKVAGAEIVSNSGRPGAAPAVVLRGVTSLNGQGRGQDPLYIVDGMI